MQSKRPRFNPLILALALAAVLMVWSVLGGTGSANSSSMEYSTVVHYFESLQVTQFSLDLNTGVITMNLKEGGKNNLPLPDTTSQSTTQATGGLLSGMLSSSDEDTAAQKNSDGTVTVRYKLPYASMFVKYVGDYIAAYDEANPDAPMVYDYTPCQGKHPMDGDPVLSGNAGLHRLPAVLHDARRCWRRRDHERWQSQGEGRAREPKDSHLCRCCR